MRLVEQPPKKPIETYDWICGDQKCDTLHCFKDPLSYQTVCNLWEVEKPTSFHDAELAQATKKINAILSRLEGSNRDPQRKLSFIQFQNRHLLVWARYGAVGPHDDPKTVIKAFGLKVPKRGK